LVLPQRDYESTVAEMNHSNRKIAVNSLENHRFSLIFKLIISDYL